MFVLQPQKGKVGTKGQKQIMEENAQTLNFYRIMILGSNGLFLVLNGFVFSEFATFEIVSVLSIYFWLDTSMSRDGFVVCREPGRISLYVALPRPGLNPSGLVNN